MIVGKANYQELIFWKDLGNFEFIWFSGYVNPGQSFIQI
jgi:hypothetical protein